MAEATWARQTLYNLSSNTLWFVKSLSLSLTECWSSSVSHFMCTRLKSDRCIWDSTFYNKHLSNLFIRSISDLLYLILFSHHVDVKQRLQSEFRARKVEGRVGDCHHLNPVSITDRFLDMESNFILFILFYW